MLAIGTDLVEIRRVERLVRLYGPRFTDRVYTPGELERCGGRMESLAARWAVKEAVMKALGSGLGEVALLEIETIHQSGGQPGLRLHGRAQERADALGLHSWAISIAHDGGMAVAFVAALKSKV
jgi:holo-[acyl-carrier protein] synthase